MTSLFESSRLFVETSIYFFLYYQCGLFTMLIITIQIHGDIMLQFFFDIFRKC